jgi:hypothetical protein
MNKLLFKKIALLFIPVGLLVMLINYAVDPANVFASKKYTTGIAEIMARGHNVDGVSNYDERLLQEEVISRLDRTPEVVVMGSSRIMEVGKNFFQNKDVLNCGVSRANVYDIVAILGILDSLHRMPKELIINLDPIFVSRNTPLEHESIYPYYVNFAGKYLDLKFLEHDKFAFENKKIKSLFSFEYFQKSLTFLRRGFKKRYEDVGLKQPVKNGRYADGSISYEASYRHPDTLLVSNLAEQTANKTGLFAPDPEKLELLNALIPVLKAKGVDVKLVLLPYHSIYFNTINQRQKGLFSLYEMLYNKVASDHGVKIIGSYNPQLNDINNRDFYDVYHCSEEAIKRVFSRYQ